MEEVVRKRVLYRSTHRGCRETDILVGKFVEANIQSLSAAELRLIEDLLEESDNDIYQWLTGQVEMPEKYSESIGKKMLEHRNV